MNIEKIIVKKGSFKRRLVAFLIDMIIFPFFFFAAAVASAGIAALLSFIPEPVSSFIVNILPFIAFFGIIYFYHVWMVSHFGGTPGKLMLDLYVIDKEERNLTQLHALLRHIAKIVSAFPAGLGLVWIIWDPKKRGWHDYLVNTDVVVKSPKKVRASKRMSQKNDNSSILKSSTSTNLSNLYYHSESSLFP